MHKGNYREAATGIQIFTNTGETLPVSFAVSPILRMGNTVFSTVKLYAAGWQTPS